MKLWLDSLPGAATSDPNKGPHRSQHHAGLAGVHLSESIPAGSLIRGVVGLDSPWGMRTKCTPQWLLTPPPILRLPASGPRRYHRTLLWKIKVVWVSTSEIKLLREGLGPSTESYIRSVFIRGVRKKAVSK